MGTALLVSGPPGSGKTTLIRTVLGQLAARAEGFLTEEVREGGERIAFRLTTLDGQSGILATVRARGGPQVGRYRVDVPTLEALAIGALEAATAAADLIVVDEIGKMELCSPRFLPALEAALASAKPLLGSILHAPHPVTDAIKRRPEVELYRLSIRNRNDLAEAIAARLQTELGLPACEPRESNPSAGLRPETHP
jgi:nucleoside-triphosphatase